MMKKIRSLIRLIIGIGEGESFEDGWRRKLLNIAKRFPHKHYDKEDLKKDLLDFGIEKGDVIIVHSSWRGMYALDLSPNAFIDTLLELIGEEGTLVMPCYGNKKDIFDVDNSKSVVGILSEILRNREGAMRSVFPKFSMVAFGRNAEKIVSRHEYSKYQFDNDSPYYIATCEYGAKVLLIGMGKKSHKITVFHCATYSSKDKVQFYNNCFAKECESVVIYKGKNKNFDYIDRIDGCSNRKKQFLRLFNRTPKKVINKPGYSIVLFNSKEAFDFASDYCMNGGKLYTH